MVDGIDFKLLTMVEISPGDYTILKHSQRNNLSSLAGRRELEPAGRNGKGYARIVTPLEYDSVDTLLYAFRETAIARRASARVIERSWDRTYKHELDDERINQLSALANYAGFISLQLKMGGILLDATGENQVTDAQVRRGLEEVLGNRTIFEVYFDFMRSPGSGDSGARHDGMAVLSTSLTFPGTEKDTFNWLGSKNEYRSISAILDAP